MYRLAGMVVQLRKVTECVAACAPVELVALKLGATRYRKYCGSGTVSWALQRQIRGDGRHDGVTRCLDIAMGHRESNANTHRSEKALGDC